MVTQLIAEAIEWCNTNEGFASIAISTVSVITAIVALCISNHKVIFDYLFKSSYMPV